MGFWIPIYKGGRKARDACRGEELGKGGGGFWFWRCEWENVWPMPTIYTARQMEILWKNIGIGVTSQPTDYFGVKFDFWKTDFRNGDDVRRTLVHGSLLMERCYPPQPPTISYWYLLSPDTPHPPTPQPINIFFFFISFSFFFSLNIFFSFF